MEVKQSPFEKYIFVCENEREAGKCCAAEGSQLRTRLKEAVAGRGLKKTIRVSRTGCLDVCAQGPNVLVMPDNRWFHSVGMDDVDTILNSVLDTKVKDI